MKNNDNNEIFENDEQLGKSLTNAFDVDGPSDSLKQRVAWMAERHDNPVTVRQPRFRFVKAFATFAALAVVLGGSLAWRYIFGRPGETAIQLIPADAAIVVTLDTTPSPTQAALFLRIKKGLEESHIDSEVNNAVKGLMETSESPISSEIKPYLTTNFAFAMLNLPKPGEVDKSQPVVFLAVNDTSKVEQIVARSGRRIQQNGLTFYRFKKDDECAMLVANYLVLAQSPTVLARIQMAYEGRTQTVAGLKEYQEARAELPEDANVMVFLSPTAMMNLDGEGRKHGVTPFRDTRWMAFSATLRDQGIAFDYRAPLTSGQQRITQLAQAPAIDAAAYKQLPSGAYGFFALSNPSAYWQYLSGMVADEAESRAEFYKSLGEFEKQTGLSVNGDILPALRGRTWFAVYPNSDKPDGLPEGMIIIDDSNGAYPAALAEKVKVWLQKVTADKGKPGVQFIPIKQGDTTIWQLDENTQKQITGSLKSMTGDEAGTETGISNSKVEAPTPTYAQVGNSIIIATSKSLLLRGVAAHQGLTPTLADDATFTAMREKIRPNAQNVMMVNLAMIMERLQPFMKDFNQSKSLNLDDITHVFGFTNTAMVASSSFDGQVESGSMFLPLDYDRVIRWIRSGMDFNLETPDKHEAVVTEK